MAVDFVGGVVLGITAVVVGLSSPSWLVHWIVHDPALGWGTIGALGPAVADRTISGSIVRGRFEPFLALSELSDEELADLPQARSISDSAWRLRNEAVRAIENRVWIVVQRSLTAESLRLRGGYEDLLFDDPRAARELVRIVRAFSVKRRLPSSVTDATSRVTPECSDESLPSLLDALASELIDAQIWEPLEVLLGSGGEGTQIASGPRRSSQDRDISTAAPTSSPEVGR